MARFRGARRIAFASSVGAGRTSSSAAAATSPGRWSSPRASRGIPAALTEADAHLGLANRLAAPFARRLFLAYEIPGVDGAKVRVVGRPIPAAHLGVSREDGRARFGFADDARVVAIFGAYAGARSLNELAVSAWGAQGPDVLHIAGERDYDQLRTRVERPGYVLLANTDSFGAALSAVDLAVSRAGGTVWELAAAGTPAVLVPYPHATADHQTLERSRTSSSGGGALIVPDEDVDRIPALVTQLLSEPVGLARMREAMLSLARPDAADVIADELVAMARRGR